MASGSPTRSPESTPWRTRTSAIYGWSAGTAKHDIQLTLQQGPRGQSALEPGRPLAGISPRATRRRKAKGSQVWLLDRRGGEAHQFTSVKEDLGDFRWSPDSKQLLLTLTMPRMNRMRTRATSPSRPAGWCSTATTSKRTRMATLRIKSRTSTSSKSRLRSYRKSPPIRWQSPTGHGEADAEWSPDGTQIAFVSNQSAPDPDRVANPDLRRRLNPRLDSAQTDQLHRRRHRARWCGRPMGPASSFARA